jgi:DNA-binding transcriptional ArsR family regulator
MSLGGTAQMRAFAHPTRLRILSLLTGAAMTAADVARELAITHANASYHLRQLLAAGTIQLAGEERINGGIARRYRYVADADRTEPFTLAERQALQNAIAGELIHRTAHLRLTDGTTVLTDADLWVEPQLWADVLEQVKAASRQLHDAALPPRTAGTIRINASIALFELEPEA